MTQRITITMTREQANDANFVFENSNMKWSYLTELNVIRSALDALFGEELKYIEGYTGDIHINEKGEVTEIKEPQEQGAQETCDQTTEQHNKQNGS